MASYELMGKDQSEFENPEKFSENGVVIVRQALNQDEVQTIRRLGYREILRQGDVRQIMPRHVLAESEIRLLPFKKRIVEALRISMGDPLAYIPDLTLHCNQFGFPGWHTDSGSEMTKAYIQSRRYKFVKCGIYLQNNTQEWGGGIIVVPGGHNYPILTPSTFINRKIKDIVNRWGKKNNNITVDIRAGDMVFFHSRLPHTSTFPEKIPQPKEEGTYHYTKEKIPEEHSKLVLYWDACNGEMVKDFMANSVRRSNMDEPLEKFTRKRKTEVFYTDYIRYHYPGSYPEDFVKAANKHNIKIASLTQSACRTHEIEFQKKIHA